MPFSCFSISFKRNACKYKHPVKKQSFFLLQANGISITIKTKESNLEVVIMKITRLDNVDQAALPTLPLHKNLLRHHAEPELLDADGKPFAAKTGNITDVVAVRAMQDKHHVQLDAKLPITVTYQLEAALPIERILLSTYGGGNPDYGFGRYEIYLSDHRESLYAPENLLGSCDRRPQSESGSSAHPGDAQIFILPAVRHAGYFGIRFTHGCAIDSVVRLDMAGLFAPYDYAKHREYCQLGACLTDIQSTVQNGMEIFNFSTSLPFDNLLVRDPHAPVELRKTDHTDFELLSATATPYGDIWRIQTSDSAMAIRSKPENIVGVFSGETKVRVLPEQIINHDFLGVGTNVLPMMLMEESLSAGYDPSFLALEQNAIRTLRPSVIRVWFQNDWFQTAPDTYDFSLPRMQAFLEYMDIFRELQTEIELDFSFAVGRAIHSWYCIPEVADQGRSAPRDLEQFARSVVAALRFLCEEKGYLVKYITISNEPNGPNFAVNGDVAKKKETYAAALRAIDTELRKAGMRERFELWGCEDAFQGDLTWLSDIHRLADDVIDRYSEHLYYAQNDDLQQSLLPTMKKIIQGKPLCMTEFCSANNSYQKSNVGCLIAAVNSGLDTTLQWCLTNAVLADPLVGGRFDEPICMYRNHNWENQGLFIEAICNQIGPAMRYVPAHCRVLATESSNPFDLRVAVFEKDGDITILVETAASGVRDLTLDLGRFTDKPFYKIACNISNPEVPTELLPPRQPITVSDGILRDRLETVHSMILYTTCQ